MGTSTSHPSPDTPSWRIVRQVLGREQAPVERQSEEIWKAVIAERSGRLQEELASPVFAAASSIAAASPSALEAARAFNQVAAEQRATGLALEMGRRALMRAVTAGGGAEGFGGELFAEAVSYYVSRDISSFVGAAGRVGTTTEAIALKDGLRAIARGVAGGVPLRTDHDGWSAFVRNTFALLARGTLGGDASTPRRPRGGRGR
jgi:hypothetical protein